MEKHLSSHILFSQYILFGLASILHSPSLERHHQPNGLENEKRTTEKKQYYDIQKKRKENTIKRRQPKWKENSVWLKKNVVGI